MLCDVLVRGGLPMALVLLILCMPIVECVCPHCFSALPSCTWETNSKCPSDTTITENIALVAAVSSATATNVGRVAPKSRRVEGGLEKLPTDHE